MKDKLFEYLYEVSKKPYQKYIKKNEAWKITIDELVLFENNTLGFQYAKFIKENQFEMQDKLEDHDAFHVLTQIGTSVSEEIAMQFFLLGNGKRSMYLFMVILSGTCFYPSHFGRFWNCYQKGKKAHRLYDLDFQKMLHQPIDKLKTTLNII